MSVVRFRLPAPLFRQPSAVAFSISAKPHKVAGGSFLAEIIQTFSNLDRIITHDTALTDGSSLQAGCPEKKKKMGLAKALDSISME